MSSMVSNGSTLFTGGLMSILNSSSTATNSPGCCGRITWCFVPENDTTSILWNNWFGLPGTTCGIFVPNFLLISSACLLNKMSFCSRASANLFASSTNCWLNAILSCLSFRLEWNIAFSLCFSCLTNSF